MSIINIRNLLKIHQMCKNLREFYILNIKYIEYLNVSFLALVLLGFTQNAFLFNYLVILILL